MLLLKPCNDFRSAEKGDRVYSYLHGWGTVSAIFPDADYGVYVKFDGYIGSPEAFTFKGYYETDNHNPTLFWGVPDIVSDARPPARYRNLNGFAVFKSPVKSAQDVEVGMYVSSATHPDGYVKLVSHPALIDTYEHYVKHGLVYPATETGRQWAIMHSKAMLGEGTPYEA